MTTRPLGQPFEDEHGMVHQIYRRVRGDYPVGRRPWGEVEDLHRRRGNEIYDDTEPVGYADQSYRPERFHTWGGEMGLEETREYERRMAAQRAKEAAVLSHNSKLTQSHGAPNERGLTGYFHVPHPLKTLITKVGDEHAHEIRNELIQSGWWSGGNKEMMGAKVLELKEDLSRYLENRAMADGTAFDVEVTAAKWFEAAKRSGQFLTRNNLVEGFDAAPRGPKQVTVKTDLTQRHVPNILDQMIHERETSERLMVRSKNDLTKHRSAYTAGDVSDWRPSDAKLVEVSNKTGQQRTHGALQQWWTDMVDGFQRVIETKRLDSLWTVNNPIGIEHDAVSQRGVYYGEARRKAQMKHALAGKGSDWHAREREGTLRHIEPVLHDDQHRHKWLPDGDVVTRTPLRHVQVKANDQKRLPKPLV